MTDETTALLTAWLCQLGSQNQSAVQSSEPRSPAEVSLPKLSSLVMSCSVQGRLPELSSLARSRARDGQNEDLSPLFPQPARRREEERSGGCSVPIEVRCGVNTPSQQAGNCCLPLLPELSPPLSLCLLPANLINHSGDTAQHQPTQPLTHQPGVTVETERDFQPVVPRDPLSIWESGGRAASSPSLLPPLYPSLHSSLLPCLSSFTPLSSFFYSLRWDTLIVAIALAFSERGMALSA